MKMQFLGLQEVTDFILFLKIPGDQSILENDTLLSYCF